MSNRRDILKVLGVVGVGTAGYVYLNSDDSPTQEDSTENGTEAAIPNAHQELSASIAGTYETVKQVNFLPSFDYEPVEASVGDAEEHFDHVNARPLADSNGDRLRIVPGRELTETEEYVRDLFGGERAVTHSVSIEGAERQFTGGTTDGLAYLVWSGSINGEDFVLVGRGRQMSVAEQAVEEL